MKEKIIVASKNPVKLTATELGFLKVFPTKTFVVEGVSVDSGVSDQPLGKEETLMGAINRADYARKVEPNADYWVGIEGGLIHTREEMESFAWIVVESKDGKLGKGKTGSFFLPQRIVEFVNQGMEFGDAGNIVFDEKNLGQENGAVGILTGDVITRTSFYEHAVILALIPIKNPDLY